MKGNGFCKMNLKKYFIYTTIEQYKKLLPTSPSLSAVPLTMESSGWKCLEAVTTDSNSSRQPIALIVKPCLSK